VETRGGGCKENSRETEDFKTFLGGMSSAGCTEHHCRTGPAGAVPWPGSHPAAGRAGAYAAVHAVRVLAARHTRLLEGEISPLLLPHKILCAASPTPALIPDLGQVGRAPVLQTKKSQIGAGWTLTGFEPSCIGTAAAAQLCPPFIGYISGLKLR